MKTLTLSDPSNRPPAGVADGSDLDRMTAVMEDALGAFRAQVEIERQRADAAEARADQAQARADQAEARADRAEARTEEIGEKLDKLLHDQKAAEAVATEALMKAEELRHAREARGRWARLRAAWRGE